MTPSVRAVSRKGLRYLKAERQGIDRQILTIRAVLGESGQQRSRTTPAAHPRAKATRPRMSAAARKAVSQRRRAYFAKRKAVKVKSKT